jgi:hypothetical protein
MRAHLERRQLDSSLQFAGLVYQAAPRPPDGRLNIQDHSGIDIASNATE